ncbi:MAG: exodeoxyribonuclease VII small subunit [Deltaproteobacteria bacterium]|nr:exodeoxyribonuclease VII small subunit [Deltaproteobacteria bacterium]
MTDVGGEMSFEALLAQVEEVLKRLQEGNVPLEEALTLYETGTLRLKAAQERLDQARQKLTTLRKEGQ